MTTKLTVKNATGKIETFTAIDNLKLEDCNIYKYFFLGYCEEIVDLKNLHFSLYASFDRFVQNSGKCKLNQCEKNKFMI